MLGPLLTYMISPQVIEPIEWTAPLGLHESQVANATRAGAPANLISRYPMRGRNDSLIDSLYSLNLGGRSEVICAAPRTALFLVLRFSWTNIATVHVSETGR